MKRTEARENTFLLLFEAGAKKDETPEEILEKAVEARGLQTDDYVTSVFHGVYEHTQEIDGVIEECLIGWKKARVSLASMAILRLATYEMMFMPDIPAKVSINEGIELSKKYDDDKSFVFINGVLNAVADKTGKKNHE